MTSSITEEKTIVYRPARANVFTLMLVLSLIALIVGCVFMYLFMAEYKFQFKGAPPVPRVTLLVPAAETPGRALCAAAPEEFLA